MRIFLGIDYGGKRVGLALGNDEARLASAHAVLSNDQQFWTKLNEVIKAEKVTKIVLGLPRGLEGQETAQTATVRQFAIKLAQATGLPIQLQDEAATTVKARTTNSGSPPDSAAAALILQDHLDSL